MLDRTIRLRHLALALLAVSAPRPAAAVVLDVTVTVTALNPDGFVEFKAESDQRGEKATGHLTAVGQSSHVSWDMGDAQQNIWYWWDTLDGRADLKVVVIGAPGVPVTLFEAACAHDGRGEVQVGRTLTVPVRGLAPGVNHYRRNPGLPPYIAENDSGAITHVKECDAPHPLKGGGKGGEEWDLVMESAQRPVEQAAGAMAPLEPGRVYLAADLYSKAAPSAEACARICAREPRCKAMTYIKDQQLCWIKHTANAGPGNVDGMVSAVKRE